MRGIILAGGTGSRLYPLTKVTNKHLLPVYNKPMVYYPLYTLKEAGIRDILIVSGTEDAGHFLKLLGSGSHLGLRLMYEVQEEAGGIAQALSLAEDFAGGEKVVVVLGDNVFQQHIGDFVEAFEKKTEGASILLTEVPNPQSYGVAEIVDGRLVSIIEKPEYPPSNLAVSGLYMYDSQVFEVIRGLKPSARNELEITDVNNHYLAAGMLNYHVLEGFWGDCGESFDSLMHTSRLVQHSALAHLDDTLSLLDRKHHSLSVSPALSEALSLPTP